MKRYKLKVFKIGLFGKGVFPASLITAYTGINNLKPYRLYFGGDKLWKY